jgi:hypothetical protein
MHDTGDDAEALSPLDTASDHVVLEICHRYLPVESGLSPCDRRQSIGSQSRFSA